MVTLCFHMKQASVILSTVLAFDGTFMGAYSCQSFNWWMASGSLVVMSLL